MVKKATYFAIPALKGYEDISVSEVPRGVARPSTYTNHIIAPFTRQFGRKTAEMSKEIFVTSVIEAPRFERILSYVKKHSARVDDISTEQIKTSYCMLIEEFYDTQSAK